MPICPECNTGYEDEDRCPKCGTPTPLETWPRPSAGDDAQQPDYGSFQLFCLHLTRILSFLSILVAAATFLFSLFHWDGLLTFIYTLIAVPVSIGIFLTIGIAIRYAEEKNGTR